MRSHSNAGVENKLMMIVLMMLLVMMIMLMLTFSVRSSSFISGLSFNVVSYVIQ